MFLCKSTLDHGLMIHLYNEKTKEKKSSNLPNSKVKESRLGFHFGLPEDRPGLIATKSWFGVTRIITRVRVEGTDSKSQLYLILFFEEIKIDGTVNSINRCNDLIFPSI